jgi:hypothetical protein
MTDIPRHRHSLRTITRAYRLFPKPPSSLAVLAEWHDQQSAWCSEVCQNRGSSGPVTWLMWSTQVDGTTRPAKAQTLSQVALVPT